MAKKKIDPLNKKLYSAVSAALTVSNIPAAVSFYQKAFGFAKRGIMNGPDGKPVHAELTLRGATLMLGPESEQMGKRSAKNVQMSCTNACGIVNAAAPAIEISSTRRTELTSAPEADPNPVACATSESRLRVSVAVNTKLPAISPVRTRSDDSITLRRDQRSARRPSHGLASAASTKIVSLARQTSMPMKLARAALSRIMRKV